MSPRSASYFQSCETHCAAARVPYLSGLYAESTLSSRRSLQKSAKQVDKAGSAHRQFSSLVVDGAERAASRAMLHAVGFTRNDFKKTQIGIASTWSMVTPCNMHIDQLAREAEAGVNAAGGKAVIFNTITISDGISMGTEGMKYSLVSREVIADSIETVVGCEGFDGLVAIGGCDKNMPGCLMAMARLNRPAVFVYGGTILPGCITASSPRTAAQGARERSRKAARHRLVLRSRRRSTPTARSTTRNWR